MCLLSTAICDSLTVNMFTFKFGALDGKSIPCCIQLMGRVCERAHGDGSGQELAYKFDFEKERRPPAKGLISFCLSTLGGCDQLASCYSDE